MVLGALLAVAPVNAYERTAMFDKNNDNAVSFEELTSKGCNISKGLFDKADKNSDGNLSNSELRTAKAYILRNCKLTKV